MMVSYPGRPPMVPMQPSVGMPYMPIGGKYFLIVAAK